MMHKGMILVLLGWLMATPALAAEVAPAGDAAVEKLIWSSEPERPTWTMEVPADGDSLVFEVGVSAPLADEAAARQDALNHSIELIVMNMHSVLRERLAASDQEARQAMARNGYRLAQAFDVPLAIDLVGRVEAKKWYRERWQAGEQVHEQIFVLVAVDKALIDAHLQKAEAELAEEAAWQLERQRKMAAEFWKQMQAESLKEE